MHIVETQTLVFAGSPFTFGFATIPTSSNGNNDGIINLTVSENGVPYQESRSNAPGTFELSESSDEVRIDWYFEPALGEHTYVFSYDVVGGVIVGTSDQGDGDQIFWKAIPPDIPGRVLNSTATIHLPEGVQPQQYTGTTDYLAEGTLNGDARFVDTRVSDNGRSIAYTLLNGMNTGDVFEVRVQFPHGILNITTPNWQTSQQREDVVNLIAIVIALLLVVIGPLGVLALWYLRGRDPELTVIIPEYLSTPPSDLPPAVVGTIIDEKADMRDIISTLVDLANRGYLTMIEEKRNHTFTRTNKDDEHLRPFEKQFLRDVFRGKKERSLDSLRYKFADRLPKLRQMLYRELVDEGLVPQSPESVRNRYAVFGWLLLGGGIISFFVLPALAPAAVCISFSTGITGVILLVVARAMPTKTAKGAEEAAKWEAFKKYLQNVESYTNLEETGEIFEKYLGYATAFGMDRSWIRKFSKVSSTPPPTWYYPYYPRGGRGYGRRTTSGPVITPGSGSAPTLEGMSGSLTGGLESVSNGLTRMLNSSSTIMRSTPPSSSSSGSFSGGFSGGGGFSSGGGGSRGFG
jgi:uncharacterized membrane protein YgcG